MINFSEKYKDLKLINNDKSKSTYISINTETNKKVILKLFKQSEYESSKFNELKNIISFSNINENENLLRIHEVGIHSYINTPYYFIEQEYIEYSTLEKELEENRFDEKQALQIMRQIINGLYDLHKLNIVFKNLSTDIMYLDEDLNVKIDTTAYLDKYNKTIKYISPEQAINKPIDKTSDIYSLGIILYEIINNELSFTWNNGKEELYKSMIEDFYIGKEKCSKDVIYILENCLYVEPSERYENLDSFLLDINSYLDYNLSLHKDYIENDEVKIDTLNDNEEYINKDYKNKKYIKLVSVIAAVAIAYGGIKYSDVKIFNKEEYKENKQENIEPKGEETLDNKKDKDIHENKEIEVENNITDEDINDTQYNNESDYEDNSEEFNSQDDYIEDIPIINPQEPEIEYPPLYEPPIEQTPIVPQPEVPTDPIPPTTPEYPEIPEQPDEPDNPQNPEIPDTPLIPEEPDTQIDTILPQEEVDQLIQ